MDFDNTVIHPNRDLALIEAVEKQLDYMDQFITEMPAPCILYSAKDIILWYNEPMNLVLDGKCGVPKAKKVPNVLYEKVSAALKDEYADHIIEENARVREHKCPQFDYFYSKPTGFPAWLCYRFLVGEKRVGTVLLPSIDDPAFFYKDL